jgi:pimeloyl-ACP methyl ester carboxylesterase
MPHLTRPDGIQIHYELRGESGPLVALFPWWSYMPGIYDALFAHLEPDHRILTYDLRGNGQSTRTGPYDLSTDVEDAEALLEEVGPAAVAITVADSDHRAAAIAARRPDLIAAVACFGTGPLALSAYRETDAMLSSLAVIEALREQLRRDQRGALRTTLAAGNPQATDEEISRRVGEQVAYSPSEAMSGRVHGWIDLEVTGEARSLGDRLWILTPEGGMGTPWFPSAAVLRGLLSEHMPQARVVPLDPGPVSSPEAAASAIREITASQR